MTNEIRDGQEIVIVGRYGRQQATAKHCDCGALCAVNAVGLNRAVGNRPVVKGPLPELWNGNDGMVCDACEVDQ